MATVDQKYLSGEDKEELIKFINEGLEFDDVIDSYLCCNCKKVAVKHFIFECGHPYCHECYLMFSNADQRPCSKCSVKFDRKIIQDPSFLLAVMNLRVKCPNSGKLGCQEVMKLKELLKHVKGDCKGRIERLLPILLNESENKSVRQFNDQLKLLSSKIEAMEVNRQKEMDALEFELSQLILTKEEALQENIDQAVENCSATNKELKNKLVSLQTQYKIMDDLGKRTDSKMSLLQIQMSELQENLKSLRAEQEKGAQSQKEMAATLKEIVVRINRSPNKIFTNQPSKMRLENFVREKVLKIEMKAQHSDDFHNHHQVKTLGITLNQGVMADKCLSDTAIPDNLKSNVDVLSVHCKKCKNAIHKIHCFKYFCLTCRDTFCITCMKSHWCNHHVLRIPPSHSKNFLTRVLSDLRQVNFSETQLNCRDDHSHRFHCLVCKYFHHPQISEVQRFHSAHMMMRTPNGKVTPNLLDANRIVAGLYISTPGV